jgi:hypothetical protein
MTLKHSSPLPGLNPRTLGLMESTLIIPRRLSFQRSDPFPSSSLKFLMNFFLVLFAAVTLHDHHKNHWHWMHVIWVGPCMMQVQDSKWLMRDPHSSLCWRAELIARCVTQLKTIVQDTVSRFHLHLRAVDILVLQRLLLYRARLPIFNNSACIRNSIRTLNMATLIVRFEALHLIERVWNVDHWHSRNNLLDVLHTVLFVYWSARTNYF